MGRPGSDLRELLVEHGVPEKGARVYLAACRAGPQTASELARLSAVNRVEAYRFIKLLSADGLLQATGGRPRRFAAIPPSDLMDRWIHRASERVRHLEENRVRVLADWEEDRTELDEHDPRKFAVLEGRETILRFLLKRIGTASHSILFNTNGRALASLIDGGVDRALRQAQRRGVKVRIVTGVFFGNLPEAKHLGATVTPGEANQGNLAMEPCGCSGFEDHHRYRATRCNVEKPWASFKIPAYAIGVPLESRCAPAGTRQAHADHGRVKCDA